MTEPLDLEAIRERSDQFRAYRDSGREHAIYAEDSADDVPALLAEMDALRTRAEFAEDKLAVAEVRIAELGDDLAAARAQLREHRELAARLSAQLAAAERERDAAIAHDRQPYPTADAYERVCEVLRRTKVERDRLAATVERVRALCANVGDEVAVSGIFVRQIRDALSATMPACICPRFRDTGGFRVADLGCPVHGVDGTDPGDGPWDEAPVDAGSTEPESAVSVDAGGADEAVAVHVCTRACDLKHGVDYLDDGCPDATDPPGKARAAGRVQVVDIGEISDVTGEAP